MKSIFTKLNLFQFGILIILNVVILKLNAQTSHSVAVTNNVFTPSTLTIDVGDTVIWTNTEGNHNVNGTTFTNPLNPESFGNSVGSGWVFEYVFNMEGVYNYQCDPHVGTGMTGMITVQGTNAIKEFSLSPMRIVKNVYPNPITSYIIFEFTQEALSDNLEPVLIIYNIVGDEIIRIENLQTDKLKIKTDNLPKGIYIYQINQGSSNIEAGKLFVR